MELKATESDTSGGNIYFAGDGTTSILLVMVQVVHFIYIYLVNAYIVELLMNVLTAAKYPLPHAKAADYAKIISESFWLVHSL